MSPFFERFFILGDQTDSAEKTSENGLEKETHDEK
jgi:hypothetical protein